MNIFKTLFITLSFLLLQTFGKAQSTKVVVVLDQLQKQYNSEVYDNITPLFSESFLKKIPVSQLENLFVGFKKDLGNLQSFTFQKKEGIAEMYIAKFENGQMNTAIAIDETDKIIGLRFTPVKENIVANFTRNATPFILPFKGDWFTFWGGDTKAKNYHVIVDAQKGAFDFLILGKNNRTYQRSGTRNEDYYAFGKPLYAVCDATVVDVITGIHDNPPGRMNPADPFGNMITLKTAADEFIVYAHFEEGTIKVKKGDVVKQGDYLGNCGNSGNSSEPHLHFHLQDRASTILAIGATSYFSNVIVNKEFKESYSPEKFDVIRRQE